MKFRVWDSVTQSYSGGELWSVDASGQLYYGNAKWSEGVVEPYTGMKDVGQKEIYIGDVVKSHEKVIYPDGKYTDICIGVVALDQKSGCLVIHNTNGQIQCEQNKLNNNTHDFLFRNWCCVFARRSELLSSRLFHFLDTAV